LAKNIASTARRQLDGQHLLFGGIFAELKTPLSPKLTDKHALSKMNLTLMEASMFYLFLKTSNYFERRITKLLNAACVSSQELGRS